MDRMGQGGPERKPVLLVIAGGLHDPGDAWWRDEELRYHVTRLALLLNERLGVASASATASACPW